MMVRIRESRAVRSKVGQCREGKLRSYGSAASDKINKKLSREQAMISAELVHALLVPKY